SQPPEFLPFLRRESPTPPAAGIDLGLLHSPPQRGLREIQLPRHDSDRLPALPHDPHCLRLELFRERPSFALAHDTSPTALSSDLGCLQNRGSSHYRVSDGMCVRPDQPSTSG